ncbi:hypothetical protein BH20CHL1_BH20CHL1_09250 [soil metagenome]
MTVAKYNWSRHLIANSGADAEQQLVAAIIAGARESCADGSVDDCHWLGVCAGAYLSLICPANIDEREVLGRLLADLPVVDDPEEGRSGNAEDFIQMLLSIPTDQEVHCGNGRGLPEMRARTRALARGDPLGQMETATVPQV